MPFWWNRRRKPWFGRWKRYRPRYKKRRWPRRRRRRAPFRRRRRRRRRKGKVRRKRQKITVKQWQPDSIVKCKIIGFGCLVAGAEGRQSFCYTNEVAEYPQPKAPGGGGFGAELYTLEYLYQQWIGRRNIWTKSNDYKDLVRYLWCTIKLYRHPTTDFIVAYNRQPPFLIEKDYYNNIHPLMLMLAKHHKVVPSLKRKPFGKPYVKMKIKPPKQMLTKWFFQQDFAEQGLFALQASACNLGWAYYGPNSQSRCITGYALNIQFYQIQQWAATLGTQPYLPYSSYPHTKKLVYWTINDKGVKQSHKVDIASYNTSVNYNTGFFQQGVLQARKITEEKNGQSKFDDPSAQANLPITAFRYNPDIDDGHGNAVWLVSTLAGRNWEKPGDSDLIISGKPLWLAFYGFWNFIQKTKKDKGWLLTGFFCVQSPAIKLLTPHKQTIFPILDLDFIQGKLPYGETITETKKNLWYPNVENQVITITNFVQTGPYIPKYAYLKESSWELTYKYIFHFKWGGPYVSDQPVQNPKDQGKYDVPDTITQTVQVSDPLKQTCKAMLRDWDYRRGIVTTTALKRMSEHLQIDSSLQSDGSETPKKKRKITAEIPHHQEKAQEMQACLLSLFEESTCQDPQDLQQLIQFQQQQQHKLKVNLLKLLMDLKHQQRILQHHTGID
nr:MAG: ORF1 [Torque teno midi virus]